MTTAELMTYKIKPQSVKVATDYLRKALLGHAQSFKDLLINKNEKQKLKGEVETNNKPTKPKLDTTIKHAMIINCSRLHAQRTD